MDLGASTTTRGALIMSKNDDTGVFKEILNQTSVESEAPSTRHEASHRVVMDLFASAISTAEASYDEENIENVSSVLHKSESNVGGLKVERGNSNITSDNNVDTMKVKRANISHNLSSQKATDAVFMENHLSEELNVLLEISDVLFEEGTVEAVAETERSDESPTGEAKNEDIIEDVIEDVTVCIPGTEEKEVSEELEQLKDTNPTNECSRDAFELDALEMKESDHITEAIESLTTIRKGDECDVEGLNDTPIETLEENDKVFEEKTNSYSTAREVDISIEGLDDTQKEAVEVTNCPCRSQNTISADDTANEAPVKEEIVEEKDSSLGEAVEVTNSTYKSHENTTSTDDITNEVPVKEDIVDEKDSSLEEAVKVTNSTYKSQENTTIPDDATNEVLVKEEMVQEKEPSLENAVEVTNSTYNNQENTTSPDDTTNEVPVKEEMVEEKDSSKDSALFVDPSILQTTATINKISTCSPNEKLEEDQTEEPVADAVAPIVASEDVVESNSPSKDGSLVEEEETTQQTTLGMEVEPEAKYLGNVENASGTEELNALPLDGVAVTMEEDELLASPPAAEKELELTSNGKREIEGVEDASGLEDPVLLVDLEEKELQSSLEEKDLDNKGRDTAGEIPHAPSDEIAGNCTEELVSTDDEVRQKEEVHNEGSAVSKRPQPWYKNKAVFKNVEHKTDSKAVETTKPVVQAKNQVVDAESELLKAVVQMKKNSQSSFGSRYKNGLIVGLSLETDTCTFQGVKKEVAAINQRCATATSKPPIYDLGATEQIMHDLKLRKRRASTGEIVCKKDSGKDAYLSPSAKSSTICPSPTRNTRNLLKTYNKDLYYSNELNHLIDVDPADTSKSEAIDYDAIKKIIEEYPSVCRTKYDLTFNGEKLHLYPLFSLVANGAPQDIIRIVFFENPFRFMDVRDKYGQTLMHYACAFSPLPISTLTFLIHRSSHSLEAYDAKNRSPLHIACANEKSDPEVVLFILKESPLQVVGAPDIEGNLPLDLALRNPHCSAALRKSLEDRSIERDEELRESALKEKQDANPVDPCDAAPATSFDKVTATASSGTFDMTVNSKSGSGDASDMEIPNPSFWERLCCRPVLM